MRSNSHALWGLGTFPPRKFLKNPWKAFECEFLDILRSKILTIEPLNIIMQTQYKYISSVHFFDAYTSSIALVKRKPSMFFTSSVLIKQKYCPR